MREFNENLTRNPARPECFSKRSVEKSIEWVRGQKIKNFKKLFHKLYFQVRPHPFDTKLLRNFTQGERAKKCFIYNAFDRAGL